MCKCHEVCEYCGGSGRTTKGNVMLVDGDIKPGEGILMVGLNDIVPCPNGCMQKHKRVDWPKQDFNRY